MLAAQDPRLRQVLDELRDRGQVLILGQQGLCPHPLCPADQARYRRGVPPACEGRVLDAPALTWCACSSSPTPPALRCGPLRSCRGPPTADLTAVRIHALPLLSSPLMVTDLDCERESGRGLPAVGGLLRRAVRSPAPGPGQGGLVALPLAWSAACAELAAKQIEVRNIQR